MAIIKGVASQTDSINWVSEGADQYIRTLRDGTVITMDWVQTKAIEGKVFAVCSGLLGTPDTFNAAIADAEQDILVTVPSGTTIIPVYIGFNVEDSGTAAVCDCVAVASNIYDNAVTATSETIKNYRTDKSTATSACTAYSVVTGNGTAVESGNFVEFWRPTAGFAEDGFNGSTAFGNPLMHGTYWSINKASVAPVIVGTGSLSIFAGMQAGTGFLTVMWVEENSTKMI